MAKRAQNIRTIWSEFREKIFEQRRQHQLTIYTKLWSLWIKPLRECFPSIQRQIMERVIMVIKSVISSINEQKSNKVKSKSNSPSRIVTEIYLTETGIISIWMQKELKTTLSDDFHYYRDQVIREERSYSAKVQKGKDCGKLRIFSRKTLERCERLNVERWPHRRTKNLQERLIRWPKASLSHRSDRVTKQTSSGC